jgi:hypothetical protein
MLNFQNSMSNIRQRGVQCVLSMSALLLLAACGGGSSSNPEPTTGGGNGGGVSALAAPSHVQIVVQGQDKQGLSNGAFPKDPHHLTIAWQSVSGATSYNIYRSVDQGPYTFHASVSEAAAKSAYSSYVANSGQFEHRTDVNSAFQDTAATNAVGSYGAYISNGQLWPPGVDGVYHAPDAKGTYFMPNVGYTYKVSAVGAGGEGAKSSDSMAIFFAGGGKVMNHPNGLFNGELVYQDTGAVGPSPLGYTTHAKWTTSIGSYINPYAGGGAVDGNLSVKGFNYLVLNVQAAQSGSSFTLSPEIAGDRPLLKWPGLQSSAYGTLVKDQWVTLKIPLSDLMVDQVGGTNAPQFAFYKVTLDSHRLHETYWLEWYFSVN